MTKKKKKRLVYGCNKSCVKSVLHEDRQSVWRIVQDHRGSALLTIYCYKNNVSSAAGHNGRNKLACELH